MLALLLGACVLALPAPMQAPPPLLDTDVQRFESAALQLAHARHLKGERSRVTPGERPDWLARTVRAYRAVRLHHPEARAYGAEAAFRAGELLRAARDDGSALEEFRVAGALGENTEFRARAGLEIGHLHRRRERPAPALDAYLRIAQDPGARRTYRDDAWLWIGVLWSVSERLEDARRVWRGLAAYGVDPLDRVRAFDRLAMSWLEVGDLEAAAAVLDECRRALAESTAEKTPRGARVRRGIMAMSVVRELPRRIALRKRAQAIKKGSPRNP